MSRMICPKCAEGSLTKFLFITTGEPEYSDSKKFLRGDFYVDHLGEEEFDAKDFCSEEIKDGNWDYFFCCSKKSCRYVRFTTMEGP